MPEEASGKLVMLRSLGLFPPPNKGLGMRLKATMAISSKLHHRLRSAQSLLDRSGIWFFSSADINLLLLIALSSSGLPHYMPCMTLVGRAPHKRYSIARNICMYNYYMVRPSHFVYMHILIQRTVNLHSCNTAIRNARVE